MDFTEVLKRSETGPMMEGEDFLLKVLAPETGKLVKEFDIRFDPACLVNTDDEMADRLFEAGKRFLSVTGIFCRSSRRVIRFSEKEIEEHLVALPDHIFVGSGNDTRMVKHRTVEDTAYPTIFGGPFNVIRMKPFLSSSTKPTPANRLLMSFFFPVISGNSTVL